MLFRIEAMLLGRELHLQGFVVEAKTDLYPNLTGLEAN